MMKPPDCWIFFPFSWTVIVTTSSCVFQPLIVSFTPVDLMSKSTSYSGSCPLFSFVARCSERFCASSNSLRSWSKVLTV